MITSEPIAIDTRQVLPEVLFSVPVRLYGTWRHWLGMKIAAVACWVMGADFGYFDADFFDEPEAIDVEHYSLTVHVSAD